MRVERKQEETDGGVQAIVRLVLHETRTPLNAICGFTDLLLAGVAGPLSAECLDYVGQVAGAARTLERGLGHLQELAAALAAADHPGVEIDLAGELAAAGFDVASASPGPTVLGDLDAWRRIAEVSRLYLQEGYDVPAAPLAACRREPDGRLEVALAGPGQRRAPGTGLLALELIRRLARRLGGELDASGPERIVIVWPAGASLARPGAGWKVTASRPYRASGT